MSEPLSTFAELGVTTTRLKAIQHIGYEIPTPIQAATIPPLLAGSDLVGQAQTGTGKTAAFALPLLERIDPKVHQPQVLVLTPTRELAIQVAEAFQSYAHFMRDFLVVPVYGGQGYEGQLRALRRGAHVVVGTPGRVMDHMRRGTLKLDGLMTVVLDEADEMLRMGFIDAVEWILEQTPATRQTALFSATMPPPIRKVANRYMRDPVEITIKEKAQTAKTIEQRYIRISGTDKLEALTRLLEVEHYDGILVFVRTKTATMELAEKLTARGFASEALNGDMPQAQRERTIERLRNGKLDLVVATDVAARGLDVERISHVINFDIPYDVESYVHRIGRTGRAGRSGQAILFVTPREQHMLRLIERTTRQPLIESALPAAEEINEQRVARFKQRIVDALATPPQPELLALMVDIQRTAGHSALDIAATLARMVQGNVPLLLKEEPRAAQARPPKFEERPPRKASPSESRPPREKPPKKRAGDAVADQDMVRYRIGVGRSDNVKPANIVGAIANEAGLDSRYILNITIHDDYSTVDLPDGMPKDVFNVLRHTWVCGKKLNLTPLDAEPAPRGPKAKPPGAGKGKPGGAPRKPGRRQDRKD